MVAFQQRQIVDASGDVVDSFGGGSGGAVTSSAVATTAVPDSATVVTLLAANALRTGASIYNDSTAALRVKLGAGASAASFNAILAGKSGAIPGGYMEVPYGYKEIITGIWESDAAGNALVGEFT